MNSLSVLLNASYHEKHKHVWLRGGDLNSFGDIMLFYEVNRVGHAWAPPGDILVSVSECTLS